MAVLLLAVVAACTTSRPTPTPLPSASGSAEPVSLQVSSVAFWADGLTGLVGLGDSVNGQVDRTADGGHTWTTVPWS